jgi:hypothetical protein
MPRTILLDELHLTVLVPQELSESTIRIIRGRLQSLRFNTRIRQAIRSVIRHHPELRKVRVRVSR